MIDDWKARKTILALGGRFVVKHDAPGFPHTRFETGQRGRLLEVGYSHYDGAYVYEFEMDGGEHKSFRLFDRQPSATLEDVFMQDVAEGRRAASLQ